MMTIQGTFGSAIVYAKTLEESAKVQIQTLVDHPVSDGQIISIMPDCLGEQTEVLTTNGFQKIIDIKPGDEIANVDNDGKVFFACPKNVIVRELRCNEVVYSLDIPTFGTSIIVTENHRNVLRSGFITSKDLPDNVCIKDIVWNGTGLLHSKSHSLKREELLLLAWIVGDGNIAVTHNQRSDNKRIRFGFCKKRKIDRVLELCDLLGIIPNVNVSKKQTTICLNTIDSIKFVELVGSKKQYPMFLITALTKDEAEAFLNEAIQVDGDYEAFINKRGMRFNSTRKQDIDFICALVSINFGTCGVSTRTIKASYAKNSVMHHVGIIKESVLLSGRSGLHNRPVTKRQIDYREKVVCLTCDSAMFIARSEGRTFVTGNCHAGAGCTIGTTMTITDKVVPNLVGVDISCGILTVELSNHIDVKKLDEFIRREIPSGFNVRTKVHRFAYNTYFKDLVCADSVNIQRAMLSIGTLGGGNHFIEVSEGKDESHYLIIHTGSRNIGKQVADIYQKLAIKNCFNGAKVSGAERDLAWLEGEDFDDYIHDMKIMENYAFKNIFDVAENILNGMNITTSNIFETVHNYIDTDFMMLRKGAVSAKKGERLLIPMNMRDGSLMCVGKGNDKWNQSAPHGAGRIMSRRQAKETLNMVDYRVTMAGIYSTSISESTLDEAPFAYKPMDEIIDQIGDTVDIIDVLKPIYNFKASEE